MKKLLALFSIFSFLTAGELKNILSNNQDMIFDYQFKVNELESSQLSNSWINPIQVNYSSSTTDQFGASKDIKQTTVTVNQPIFRSGGIYFAIQYADALKEFNHTSIKLQKNQSIADAVTLLLNIKKSQLEKKKLLLQIKNDELDIEQKQQSYAQNLLDSSFLDQAILKKSKDEIVLYELESMILDLSKKFKLLTNKNPNSFVIPEFKLIEQDRYLHNSMELKKGVAKSIKSEYDQKMTIAKYLPSISLNYYYSDADNTLFASSNTRYENYGFTVSMPIDFNSLKDIEAKKIDSLKSQVELIEIKKTLNEDYLQLKRDLNILDKKISLSTKDVNLYVSMLNLTNDLVKAGEKPQMDSDIMSNSLKMKELDIDIYKIDKQLEIVSVYSKVDDVF